MGTLDLSIQGWCDTTHACFLTRGAGASPLRLQAQYLPCMIRHHTGDLVSNQALSFGATSPRTCRYLDPKEIEICKQDDGSEWLLGTGNYGRVSVLAKKRNFSATRQIGGRSCITFLRYQPYPLRLAVSVSRTVRS